MAEKDYTDEVSKLAGKVAALPLGQPRPGVYFFMSFDLVNSTKFKAQKQFGYWPMVVDHFYDLTYKEARKVDGARVWKYVGDEVLFYKRLKNVADLEESIRNAFSALKGTISSLHGAFPETKTLLSVKGTCWIAPVNYIPPEMLEELKQKYNQGSAPGEGQQFPRNIIVQTPHGPVGGERLDFLGPDIDAGFRIAKYTEKRLLVVSADAALVLRAKGSGRIAENLNIVGYRQLKGVWSDRSYPIIWFFDPWDTLHFEYDERDSNELIANVEDKKTHPIKELERIYRDRRSEVSAEELISLLEAPAPAGDANALAAPAPEMDVHCVAVCFNTDGRILIARRPADKPIAPNAWEFGCSQLTPGQDFHDCIRDDYASDFGAKLEFFYAHPFRQFVLNKQGTKVPGLIFSALVTNAYEVDSKFSRVKHTEIRWLDPSDMGINEAECVPDFRMTVEQAAKLWREHSGKLLPASKSNGPEMKA